MFKSLRKNQEFVKVYRKGRSKADRYLVMYVLEEMKNENRYGISVSKKVGNSVVRHRIKRLIRESVRLNEGSFNKGYDVVIVARNAARGKEYREIEESILQLGKRHKIVGGPAGKERA